MNKKYKLASFSIEEELLNEFRIEVKKSPYNQKYILNKYLRIITDDIKLINKQDGMNNSEEK